MAFLRHLVVLVFNTHSAVAPLRFDQVESPRQLRSNEFRSATP